ncbi:MAG TPA: S41 family peptidase [Thermoanaerobaculia bacterium]|nr:S41 family peptidase [Thermoanaerobaculia bacterium]
MLKICVLAVLLLVTLSLCAASPGPVNLDFESGAPGEVPPGWLAPTAGLGYTVELSTASPKQGKQSVQLSGKPQPGDGKPGFGNVMQRIDAKPYRGKHVRFRAAVRSEGTAALWMRVDRADKQPGFFDNMDDRPIRSGEWAYYEITGAVAPDAEVLNVGMMVKQEGRAWLDDVTLETVKVEVRAAPPRAITARGMENLVAFTRLLGIVRYFHPSDEAAGANWDAIAVEGAEAVEGAKDAAELASRLSEIFLPVAPSLQVFPSGAPREAALLKPADAQTIVAWEHAGVGTKEPRSIYQSERVRRAAGEADARYPDPLQPLRIDLGGGVSAAVPLTVYATSTHTLPRPAAEARPHGTALHSGNDRASRIGAVVLVWNVLQHFYPYFDVVDVDWPAQLKTTLQAAGTDRDEQAFLLTLRRMMASIDDGHGSVQLLPAQARASLPLLWRAIGDALVVTAVDAPESGVNVGDEVIAIDGRPAMQALREVEERISSATPQWRRVVGQRNVAAGDAGSKSVLTIRNADGSTRTVTLTRAARTEPLREKRPEMVAELKPGILYVDLDRLKDPDFEAALPKLAAARGIVFDLRGYPRGGTKPLLHLIDGPTDSAQWNIPVSRRPDRQGVEWNTRGRWQLKPQQPRFTKNVVFLTDGRAISYAETWMGIVEAYKLGTIVGETTAGTNGNINSVTLPGGYRVIFTGMKVLKHDGSRHHGIGIVPNVPVSPTAAGIRAGRDEQLEKAIEILEKK